MIMLAFYVFRVTVGTRFLSKIRVCSCSSFSTNTAYYNVIDKKKKPRRRKSDKKISTRRRRNIAGLLKLAARPYRHRRSLECNIQIYTVSWRSIPRPSDDSRSHAPLISPRHPRISFLSRYAHAGREQRRERPPNSERSLAWSFPASRGKKETRE